MMWLTITFVGVAMAWLYKRYNSHPKPSWYQWTLIPISRLVFQPQRPSYRATSDYFYLKTKNTKQDICCHYIPVDGATQIIIFSHGNAEDIGQILYGSKTWLALIT